MVTPLPNPTGAQLAAWGLGDSGALTGPKVLPGPGVYPTVAVCMLHIVPGEEPGNEWDCPHSGSPGNLAQTGRQMEGNSKRHCEREAENEGGKTRPVVTAQTETWGPTERGAWEGLLPPAWELELGERHPCWPLTVPIMGPRARRQIHLWGPPLPSRGPGPWPGPVSARPLGALCLVSPPFPQGPSISKLPGRLRTWVRGGFLGGKRHFCHLATLEGLALF